MILYDGILLTRVSTAAKHVFGWYHPTNTQVPDLDQQLGGWKMRGRSNVYEVYSNIHQKHQYSILCQCTYMYIATIIFTHHLPPFTTLMIPDEPISKVKLTVFFCSGFGPSSPPAPCLTGWVASTPRKKEMSKINDAVPREGLWDSVSFPCRDGW